MPELHRDDIVLHYEITGSGPPLLLIPGMLGDGASWGPLIPALAAHHRLILPDPRASGRTRPHDAPITLAHLSADMVALLDHLQIARAGIVGHSLGGHVGLALAGAHADRITGLVALATGALPDPRSAAIFDILCTIRASGDETLWLRALYPVLFSQDFFHHPQGVADALVAALAYPHAQTAAAMRHQVAALARMQATPARPAGVPVLAVLAGEDTLIPRAATVRAWQEAGAAVETVAEAGHALHWQAPDAVASSILRFFARRQA